MNLRLPSVDPAPFIACIEALHEDKPAISLSYRTALARAVTAYEKGEISRHGGIAAELWRLGLL